MSRTPVSFAPFGQAAYVVQASTPNQYDNMLGQLCQHADTDVIAGLITPNSQMPRNTVIVKNGSGATILPGTPLNWAPNYWGTQVQPCPVGQQIRGFAPGYINGSLTTPIPINAYFQMVYFGPTTALNNGNSMSVNDGLVVTGTAGQLNSDRTQFASTGASAAVTNTTTNTAFATNQYTYIANSLLAGDVIRLTGTCPITWATGTIKFQVLIGTTVVSDTGAYTPATGDIFTFDTLINLLTIGASGTLTGSGTYFAPTTGAQKTFTALGSTAVDTTATQLVSVKVTWGTANAGNSVTLSRFQAQKVIAGGVNAENFAYALQDVTGAGTAANVRVRANCQW
jgi:hypothetical protein